MAPKPLSTTIRTSRSTAKPAIYAVHAGPQRGVHLLSAEPLPPQTQYLYRHPINVHRTFLTVTGDFLRRRFDSIEAAVKWIDERDRERELSEALAGTSLSASTPTVATTTTTTTTTTNAIPPSSSSSSRATEAQVATMVAELATLRASELVTTHSPHSRQRRASDPVYKYTSKSGGISKGGGGGGGGEKKKVVAVRGKYGMSHLGVRNREFLYSLVGPGEEASRMAEERGRAMKGVDKMEGIRANESAISDGDDMEIEEEL
ncbi:hypothetical protein FN846DRAFT_935215 [Sphaerosporella brunnea]|uniref:Uncharacterized protein n=1 Tax=Sphaerosporella brunnea TaxID=1250544 RepID=A0A5J5F5I7_9PEZI|nr:hypothetical protein FN846DRAFT_935215 [Sphaerosporella brunnea]